MSGVLRKIETRFYVDILPGQDMSSLYAATQPGVKTEGFKRYAFTVYIPDNLGVDQELPVENFKEVDAE